jgi:hypothetical protein
VGHALRCKKSRRKNDQASMAAVSWPPVWQAPSMRQDRAWVGNPIAGLGMLNPTSVAALSREWLASKVALRAFGSLSVTSPSYLGPRSDHLSEAVSQLARPPLILHAPHLRQDALRQPMREHRLAIAPPQTDMILPGDPRYDLVFPRPWQFR